MRHNKKIGKRHAYWFYINSSRQNTSQDVIRPNTAHSTTPSTKSSVRSNATPSVRSNTKLKESDSNTSNGREITVHKTVPEVRAVQVEVRAIAIPTAELRIPANEKRIPINGKRKHKG